MAEDSATAELLELVLDAACPLPEFPLLLAHWELKEIVDLDDSLNAESSFCNDVASVSLRADLIDCLACRELNLLHGCIDVDELDGWEHLEVSKLL